MSWEINYYPVKRLGNGIEVNSTFYPFKHYYTTDPDAVLPSKSENWLYIEDIAYTLENTAATNGEKIYWYWTNYAVFKLYTVPSVAASYNGSRDIRTLIPPSVTGLFSTAGVFAQVEIWVRYCYIPDYDFQVNEDVSYPLNAYIKVCDLWSWIKGECVHGIE